MVFIRINMSEGAIDLLSTVRLRRNKNFLFIKDIFISHVDRIASVIVGN